jgi:hypothetical protein
MKFKELEEPVYTSDTFYDLFEGGYIKPEELLEDPKDAEKIRATMKVIELFLDEAQDAGCLEIG